MIISKKLRLTACS